LGSFMTLVSTPVVNLLIIMIQANIQTYISVAQSAFISDHTQQETESVTPPTKMIVSGGVTQTEVVLVPPTPSPSTNSTPAPPSSRNSRWKYLREVHISTSLWAASVTQTLLLGLILSLTILPHLSSISLPRVRTSSSSLGRIGRYTQLVTLIANSIISNTHSKSEAFLG
jgi:hypothetical protein